MAQGEEESLLEPQKWNNLLICGNSMRANIKCCPIASSFIDYASFGILSVKNLILCRRIGWCAVLSPNHGSLYKFRREKQNLRQF